MKWAKQDKKRFGRFVVVVGPITINLGRTTLGEAIKWARTEDKKFGQLTMEVGEKLWTRIRGLAEKAKGLISATG